MLLRTAFIMTGQHPSAQTAGTDRRRSRSGSRDRGSVPRDRAPRSVCGACATMRNRAPANEPGRKRERGAGNVGGEHERCTATPCREPLPGGVPRFAGSDRAADDPAPHRPALRAAPTDRERIPAGRADLRNSRSTRTIALGESRFAAHGPRRTQPSRNNATRSQRFVVEVADFSSRNDRAPRSNFLRSAERMHRHPRAPSRNNATRLQRFLVEVDDFSSRSDRAVRFRFSSHSGTHAQHHVCSHGTRQRDRSDLSSKAAIFPHAAIAWMRFVFFLQRNGCAGAVQHFSIKPRPTTAISSSKSNGCCGTPSVR